jgi:hypothetical protein
MSMPVNHQSVRQPVIRQRAETYLLITLLSFAASVALTRLFLELAGYPQLGRGPLHIAHVLWGGLLLFGASLLPLILANRWVYSWSSLLAGVGVGLFIDEVGKFITQTNDYFYPAAAPIIYAFFLLTVLVYLHVRRSPGQNPRAELYRVLDMLQELLDHDLDRRERADCERRLEYVREHASLPNLANLAEHIREFLVSDRLYVAPARRTWAERMRTRVGWFDRRFVTRRRLKAVLIGGLLAIGAMALANMATLLADSGGYGRIQALLMEWVVRGRASSPAELLWLIIRASIEAIVGLSILASGALLLAGRDRAGANLAAIGLLAALGAVNLLVFYFEQFSTIITAAVQFGMLLAVSYYRKRFLSL